MKALLAKKIGMTQLIDTDGKVSAVTVLEAGPCVVTQLKTDETDGYNAVQLGFGEAKHPGKSILGHLKAAKAKSAHLAEIRLPEAKSADQADAEVAQEAAIKVGDVLQADLFETGEAVQVTAVSKGKGFAGTIKRHNFHRGPKTHGSHNYRAPGSIGAGYPQHVFRGQKMAGRMGNAQVTIKNQKVLKVDAGSHLLAIAGSVPGVKGTVVLVRGAQS